MTATSIVTKDPICGMTVDQKTALRVERDGKTFFFCGEKCRTTFLTSPAGSKPKATGGGCCG